MLVNLKKIITICFVTIFFNNISSFASDNVLQAIQINGIKDSYNIILKSDDVAEVKKTVQAPNKMILVLKGIRASKTINTIYSNTSTVDSVVVEPINEETVKILIQASNVANSQIHFDSLKTPLGILDNEKSVSRQNDTKSEILLSAPLNSYRPVYEREEEDLEQELFPSGTESLTVLAKKILKNDKISWMITFGLFTILVLSSIGMLRRKENEVKIGLNHGLQQREIDLYRNMNTQLQNTMSQVGLGQVPAQNSQPAMNYGLKAYQNNTKNPYTSSEIQRARMVPSANANLTGQSSPISSKQPSFNPSTNTPNALQKAAQDIIRRNTEASGIQKASLVKSMTKPVMTAQKPQAANIDSMKFLESMTKIYEKNGRSDLAQGLKNNIQKVKSNIA